MARQGQLHGTYDFNKVSLIYATRELSGFENGTSITVARATPSFSKKVDIDGAVTRSRSNDTSGTYSFSLSQLSEDNQFLLNILNIDERTGAGIFPVKLVDRSNPINEIVVSLEAWVQTQPSRTFGMESGAREWVIEAADITFL